MMNRIFTSLALCFAIAAAQQQADNNNATDSSASVAATAPSSSPFSEAASRSTGPVVMVPVAESSEAALDTPTSTPAATTPESKPTEASQQQPSPAPSDDAPPASRSQENTQGAVATPPATTENAPAGSSPHYTFAPTTAENTTPVAPSPVQASSENTLNAPLVAQTETPGSQLDTPTPSPNDAPANTNSPEYTFAPTTPVNEGPASTPHFSFAPTSADETPAAPVSEQPKPEYTFAPSSDESSPTPAVAPVPVPVGSSASFVVGSSDTIQLGETATVNSEPVIIQTNSLGNTEIQVGATGTPSMLAYPTSEVQLPETGTAAEHLVSEPTAADTIQPTSATATPTSETLASPVFTSHSPSIITLNGHTLTLSQPALKSNEIYLNGKTLTVSPVAASTSVLDHVVTINGHEIPVGAATLAAEPTEVSSPSGESASLEGAASRGEVQSWVFAALGMVFGAIALVL